MQRLPKMSTPIWAMLGVWTVLCGFLTMHSVGLLGQWKQRANGFQRTNGYLARELTLTQQQLQQTRTDLATTRTRLAATQNQLLNLQIRSQSPAKTALFEAIRRNDAHAVSMLLDSGVNPNSLDIEHGQDTALVEAVEVGYIESPVYPGASPRNNLAVVRALLAHGAHVNRPCPDGITTPLSVARRHGSGALIDLLEAAGAKE